MTRQRKCRDCKKELTGKYYIIAKCKLNFRSWRGNYQKILTKLTSYRFSTIKKRKKVLYKVINGS